MFTIPLFLAGFLPVVGQSVVPVLAALLTAWFMALEVTAVPFYRRGIGLRIEPRCCGAVGRSPSALASRPPCCA